MDTAQFDKITRRLGSGATRRRALGTMALGVLGVITAHQVPEASAKKRKAKRAPLNAFGCLNVGARCHGNSANCCSGICQGKKPKHGAKDKSRCVSHNEGGCAVGVDSCVAMVECGTTGRCYTTTGNASFCGAYQVGDCRVCATDQDCVGLGFGAGAACLTCPLCSQTGNTACAPAAA
jgi:hypothetical protein